MVEESPSNDEEEREEAQALEPTELSEGKAGEVVTIGTDQFVVVGISIEEVFNKLGRERANSFRHSHEKNKQANK